MHTDLRDHGFVMNGVLVHHKQPVAAKCKFVMDPGPDSHKIGSAFWVQPQNRAGVLGPATKSGRRFGSSHKVGSALWVQPQNRIGVLGIPWSGFITNPGLRFAGSRVPYMTATVGG